jgi:regulator of sigma D
MSAARFCCTPVTRKTSRSFRRQAVRGRYKGNEERIIKKRRQNGDCFMNEVNMQTSEEAAIATKQPVERRAQSHQDIDRLVESRNETLALLSDLASRRPFKPEHDTQVLLQNFCESLIDYTASAHFQLYQHIDEDKERRAPVRKMAGEVYPRIMEITQTILDFNDKYDCEDHCDDLSDLAEDLSELGEVLADRIELEDRIIQVMRRPRGT